MLADEVSEDRMIALRKRAEVEAKYVVMLNPNDESEFQQSLNRHVLFYQKLVLMFKQQNVVVMSCICFGCRLGNTFSELSSAYYREEGRRVKQRIERKNVSSVELIVRYCFKVGIIHFVFVLFSDCSPLLIKPIS